jgi:transglutaminase-like putative cysteine protease
MDSKQLDIRPLHTMQRILRNDRTGRQPTHLHIDKQLLAVLDDHHVANKSDIANVAIEIYLRGKGWMPLEPPRNHDPLIQHDML